MPRTRRRMMGSRDTHRMRIWRQDNPKKVKEHNRSKKLKNRQQKLYLISLLGGKCIKCGYNKSVSSFHFHHMNPDEKEGQIAYLSFDKQLEEIKKCILLCANCHGEIHEELNGDK